MPRFVLLEHCWNGVHWDFMLESADGRVLHTWAIDAPVVAGDELPARRLADHRTAYLDYEGAVSGGRGVVRRVDRGEYEARSWALDCVRVRIAGAQLVGLVEVRAVSTEGGRGWTFRLRNFD
jgi:hypothetical protein